MGIHIVSDSTINCGNLLLTLSKFYRSDPIQHCYLIYDILYEYENTEVIIKVSPIDTIEAYILLWYGPWSNGIITWGLNILQLFKYIRLEPNRPVTITLPNEDLGIIEGIISYLKILGFKMVEVRRFYDMVCDERSFNKFHVDKQLINKLTEDHVELFRVYMRSRGHELTLQEIRNTILKREYYGVIIDDELVSTAAICIKLPEVCVICDVYTKPVFRGRGYATSLTSIVTERVLMSGAIALLSVEVGNKLALNIYRKLGYRVIRTRPWIMAYP